MNQIYDYLDSLRNEKLEQQENINKIKQQIEELKTDEDAWKIEKGNSRIA